MGESKKESRSWFTSHWRECLFIGLVIVLFVVLPLVMGVGKEAEQPIQEVIRKPAVAGQFYPGTASALDSMLSGFFDQAKPVNLSGEVRGLVVPHAGYVYSGQVAANGFQLVDQNISTVIVLAPSHHVQLSGASIPDVTHYQTPLGKVALSSRVRELKKSNLIGTVPQAHAKEHAVEVEIPFLQRQLGEFELVPIVTKDASPEELANALQEVMDDQTLVVASSDLSHYYPYEQAVQLDSICTQAIPSLNFSRMQDCEACGKVPILTLMHLAKEMNWQGKLVDYKNSGDTAGNKQRVVGYATVAFAEPGKLAYSEQRFLMELARKTLDSYLKNSTKPRPREVPQRLRKVQGCFVTLNKNDQLRGCIGHILPQEELYQCVIDNAVSAAVNDQRFQPVKHQELEDIELDISVLSVPRRMPYSSPEQLLQKLQPLEHGVIIKYRGGTSTYLPQVWEQLPDKRNFLSRLCMKQGAPADCWKGPAAEVYVYTAQVFYEHEFD